jgi:hypothetical protein
MRQLIRHLLPVGGAQSREPLSADLVHASKSFGSLLQSGFSLLGVQGARQAHAADHERLVVFVVGGISCVEARELSAHAPRRGPRGTRRSLTCRAARGRRPAAARNAPDAIPTAASAACPM